MSTMLKINGKYYYQLICNFCNKEFKNRNNVRFCSPKCGADNRYKDKSKNKTVDIDGIRYYKLVCGNCKKDFLAMHNQPFCSHDCFGKDFEKRGHVSEKHQGCKYHYNRNYFHTVDTPTKAYWVGFIVGDGNLQKMCSNPTLQFGLAPKDKQLLYNFIDEIGGDYKQIKERPKNKMTQLRISSKEMVNDLIKIGVPSHNKTFTATVPNIPEEYMSAFYLGLFDADGCVSIYEQKRKCKDGIHKHKTLNVNLVGTKNVCIAFSKFLGYDGKYVYPIGNVYRFDKGGKYITEDIYKKLYKFNIPSLERKKEKFIKMLSLVGDY